MRTTHRFGDMRLLALVVLLLLVVPDVFAQVARDSAAFPFLSISDSQRQAISTGFQMQWFFFKGFQGATVPALYYLALAATLIGALAIVFNKEFHDIKTSGTWLLLVVICLFAPFQSKLLFYDVPSPSQGIGSQKPESIKGFTPQLLAAHIGTTAQVIFYDLFKSYEFKSLVNQAISEVELSQNVNINMGGGWLNRVNNFRKDCGDIPIVPNLSKNLTSTPATEMDSVGSYGSFDSVLSQIIKPLNDVSMFGQSFMGKDMLPSIPLYKTLPSGYDSNSYVAGIQDLYNKIFAKNEAIYIPGVGTAPAKGIPLAQAVDEILNHPLRQKMYRNGTRYIADIDMGNILFYLDEDPSSVGETNGQKIRKRVMAGCPDLLSCNGRFMGNFNKGLELVGDPGAPANAVKLTNFIGKNATPALLKMPANKSIYTKDGAVAAQEKCSETDIRGIYDAIYNAPGFTGNFANRISQLVNGSISIPSDSKQITVDFITGGATGLTAAQADLAKLLVNILPARIDELVRKNPSAENLNEEKRKIFASMLIDGVYNSTIRNTPSSNDQAIAARGNTISTMDPNNVGILATPLGAIAKVAGSLMAWFGSAIAGASAIAVIYFLQAMIEMVLLIVLMLTPLFFLFGILIPKHAFGLLVQSFMVVLIVKLVPVTFLIVDTMGTIIYNILSLSGSDLLLKKGIFLFAIAGLYAALLGMTMLLLFKIGEVGNIEKLRELDSGAEKIADAGMKVATALGSMAAIITGAGVMSALSPGGAKSPGDAMKAAFDGQKNRLMDLADPTGTFNSIQAAVKDGKPEEAHKKLKDAVEEKYRADNNLVGKDLTGEQQSELNGLVNEYIKPDGDPARYLADRRAEMRGKYEEEVRQTHKLGKNEDLDSQQQGEVDELMSKGIGFGAASQEYLANKRGAPWAATKARIEQDSADKVRDFHGVARGAELTGDLKADAAALTEAELSGATIDSNKFLLERMTERNVANAQAPYQAAMAAANATQAQKQAIQAQNDSLDKAVMDHFISEGVYKPSQMQIDSQRRLMEQGLGRGTGNTGGGGGGGSGGGYGGGGIGGSGGPSGPGMPAPSGSGGMGGAPTPSTSSAIPSGPDREELLQNILNELRGIRSGGLKVDNFDELTSKMVADRNKMAQDAADKLQMAQLKQNFDIPKAEINPGRGMRFMSGAVGAFLASGATSNIPGANVVKEVFNEWSEGPERARVWANNGGMMKWFGARSDASRYEALKKAQQPYGSAAEYTGLGEAGAFNSAVKQATMAAAQAVAKAQSAQVAIQIKESDLGKGLDWKNFKNADLAQAIESLESTLSASAMMNGGMVRVGDGKQEIQMNARTVQELVGIKGYKQVQGQLDELLGGHMYIVTKDGKAGAMARRYGDTKGIQQFIREEIDTDYQPGAIEKWYNGKAQFFALQGRAEWIKDAQALQAQMKRDYEVTHKFSSSAAASAAKKKFAVERYHTYQQESGYSQMATSNYRTKYEDVRAEMADQISSLKNTGVDITRFKANVSNILQRFETQVQSLNIPKNVFDGLKIKVEQAPRRIQAQIGRNGLSHPYLADEVKIMLQESGLDEGQAEIVAENIRRGLLR
ncbi:MAG: hypothetical protein WAZ18_00810 [Alphaproteobacteria bacterium]